MKTSVLLLILISVAAVFARETFVVSQLQTVNFIAYVPAVQNGPFINRSCRARTGCTVSSNLPAIVIHRKTDDCMAYAGRILAESVWTYYKDSMPLTIFNGWQWQYNYGICQFKKSLYDLDRRGGCWETAMEAKLNCTFAGSKCNWLRINSDGSFSYKPAGESNIEILNFSNLRDRNGYPKNRKLGKR